MNPAIGQYNVGPGYVATLAPAAHGRFAPWSHVVTLWKVGKYGTLRKVAHDVTAPEVWQATADRLYVTAV